VRVALHEAARPQHHHLVAVRVAPEPVRVQLAQAARQLRAPCGTGAVGARVEQLEAAALAELVDLEAAVGGELEVVVAPQGGARRLQQAVVRRKDLGSQGEGFVSWAQAAA
jgi:hypothetical protein